MNYRQWKKNYKKQHGYNPPMSEDKRQQAKKLKKALRRAKLVMKDFRKALFNGVAAIFEGIGGAFKAAGEASKNIADSFTSATEAVDKFNNREAGENE